MDAKAKSRARKKHSESCCAVVCFFAFVSFNCCFHRRKSRKAAIEEKWQEAEPKGDLR